MTVKLSAIKSKLGETFHNNPNFSAVRSSISVEEYVLHRRMTTARNSVRRCEKKKKNLSQPTQVAS